ncbi:phospholipase C, phosphocholine-specific [Sediminibacterium roseum]|uniref:phospholipase C n=1 Tax=Sediminibacterium roseum TaxID=1978412 RepID=A0ABW9ZZ87_9BACT|nr:phospholipase C, phosphocholine-specific [Sediminibacterium roseum]NCI50498.1 phospholipase C, phosphocholine-specific [Sediminibacterium roseum]
MNSRRDFLKKAAVFSGGTAMMNMFPPVIQKALAINPALGSTFLDAEHIVFLMQENRSFDHQLGTLQGVRGFNDPRAIQLPDKNKVWLQTNKEGETYGPAHLNVKDTRIAWMGSLPHNWTDQTDAMNLGKYDKWLDTKKARNKAYAAMPLTMGYCDRFDFPFYYSLADAFTVCDQNFCSSITGTHSNRHYWMTGTNREKNDPSGIAHVWNVSNYEYPELDWKTYPERLQENGITWKIYQNELTMGYGLKGEESAWLSNFGCNVMEYFKQYNVRLHEGGIENLETKRKNLTEEIATLEKDPAKNATRLAAAKKLLGLIATAQQRFTKESFSKLSNAYQEIHNRAFVTNSNDPLFHELAPFEYENNGEKRKMNMPKGDIFHQFRQDVKNGTLPTVSWLTPPANFSDHPGEPWFGPWYVSEAMEILLENPEVWKKTIFILTYDENDGYFDHVPPYIVPNPYKENTGKVSKNIDPKMDFVLKDQQHNSSASAANIREASLGLGYRVPMVIASPWTRGGFVCSELFDHTSSLQFLETFIEKKFGKKIKEENITEWRRMICGDLSSAFRSYNGEPIKKPEFIAQKPFVETIHQAQFKKAPADFKLLGKADIDLINTDHAKSPYFPKQEKGIRDACALPYELYVNCEADRNAVGIRFAAGKKIFGNKAAGSPFKVYAMNPYRKEVLRVWDYSVSPGDVLKDEWKIADFDNNAYHLRVYAPNGFYREFMGNPNNPLVKITCEYETGRINTKKLTGNLVLSITNNENKALKCTVRDNSYKTGSKTKEIAPGAKTQLVFDLSKSYHWYDCSVVFEGYSAFEERFAGKVETGEPGKTDPLMGDVVS